MIKTAFKFYSSANISTGVMLLLILYIAPQSFRTCFLFSLGLSVVAISFISLLLWGIKKLQIPRSVALAIFLLLSCLLAFSPFLWLAQYIGMDVTHDLFFYITGLIAGCICLSFQFDAIHRLFKTFQYENN